VEAGGKSPREQGTSEAPDEKHGLSRKQFVVGGAAAGAAIGLGGAGAALAAGKAPATPKSNPDREFDAIAFINGRIHTMDPQNRVVSQIVIRDAVLFQDRDWSQGAILADPGTMLMCPAAVNDVTGSAGVYQPGGFGQHSPR